MGSDWLRGAVAGRWWWWWWWTRMPPPAALRCTGRLCCAPRSGV